MAEESLVKLIILYLYLIPWHFTWLFLYSMTIAVFQVIRLQLIVPVIVWNSVIAKNNKHLIIVTAIVTQKFNELIVTVNVTEKNNY